MVGLVGRSISAAALVLCIVLLRAILLHKLPKLAFQVMWAVVILRLLLPFSISVPGALDFPGFLNIPSLLNFSSLLNSWLEDAWLENAAPDDTELDPMEGAGDIYPGSKAAEGEIPGKEILGKGVSQKGISEKGISEKGISEKGIPEKGTLEKGIPGKGIPEKGLAAGQGAASNTQGAEDASESGQFFKSRRNKLALRVFWLAGAVLSFSYFAVSHIRYRKRYAAAIPVGLPDMNLASFTKRRVQIKVSDRLPSPLTYGILSPVILLPKATDWENKEQLFLILAHEAVHIRRFDVLYKWAMTLAVCLHWFNPFVWIMFVLAGRDMELSCDEAVLKRLHRRERADYALTLLCFEERRSISPGLNRFGGNAVKERIEAIMKFNKTSALGTALAVLLIAGSSTVFAASRDNSYPGNGDGKGAANAGKAVNGASDYEVEKQEVKQYICEPSYYTAEEFEETMRQERQKIEEQLSQGLLQKEEADQMLSDLENTHKEIQGGKQVEKPSPVYYADGKPVLNSRGEQLYVKASDIKRMNEELSAKAQINSAVPAATVAEEDTVSLVTGIPVEAGEESAETSVEDKFWYTYEEYAEYVEKQKKEYASMLGDWGFNSTDGWYEWTKERIEEACRLLDTELEFIKNGGFISKPTEWEEGGALMGETIMYSFDENLVANYAEEIDVMADESVDAALVMKEAETTSIEGGHWDSGYLKDYEAYGVTADEEAQYYLYQGKPIAGFIDQGFRMLTDGMAKEAGGVFIKVIREDNQIKELTEISKEEFMELSGLTIY